MITDIGTLNEGSLHAELKKRYAAPGDLFEANIGGHLIDVVRDPGGADELLIEIQTGSLAALGPKLDRLLPDHRVLLVHPIATRIRLVRDDRPPRRSPKRGSVYAIFDELVSLPTLLDHPNLSLEIVLFEESRRQIEDPTLRRRRGGWRTVDRSIDEVVAVERFDAIADLLRLLPPDLPESFTTADLADTIGCPRALAQKLAYCFRHAGLIESTGRTAAGLHYRLTG